MYALIVDDSLAIRSILTRIVSGKGFRILAVGNGAEAYELIRNTKLDIVFLDYNLPDATGYDILKVLRNEGLTPQATVVMVSTESDAKTMEGMRALGIQGHVAKPFTAERIEEVLRELGYDRPKP